MSVLDKMKSSGFWKNFLKIALPFFILVTLISLLMNSWRAIFAGDFNTVKEFNFADGKWQPFFGFKIIFTSIYALYVTIKKTK